MTQVSGRANSPGVSDLDFLNAARDNRDRTAKSRMRAATGVSVAVTVCWAVYVTASGQWDRVADRWAAALTMIFGSFVAGSTPQGGGAVAFPVFTKLLKIPTEVARTFSLSIQTIGMGAATASILITRRRVEWRAIAIGVPPAIVAFIAAVYLLGDGDTTFWPATVPGPYVKVTFTLVLAAMAWVVLLGQRIPVRLVGEALPDLNRRLMVALVLSGILGGTAAALVGSGADVFAYLFVVVLFGIDPKVGVPTSVVAMTCISVVGFILLGLVDGQLATTLNAAGDTVIEVGGQRTNLRADRHDLFGLWLASVPVVAWGAPLGSLVASRLSARQLVTFVISLALLEVLSTAIFLEELRTSLPLATFAIVGLIVSLGGLTVLARNRQRLFGLPGVAGGTTLVRNRLDITDTYTEALDSTDKS